MEQTQTPTTTNQRCYKILERELGGRLSTKEVAAYLGLDEENWFHLREQNSYCNKTFLIQNNRA